MIDVSILRHGGRIVSYRVSGHAKYDEIGKDIICAAVSAVCQQTAVGIIGYLKINVEPKFKDGFMNLDLRGIDLAGKDKETETLLETMYLTLLQIEEQYPDFLKIMEKEGK